MEEMVNLGKDQNKHLTLWLPLIILIENINIIGKEAPSLFLLYQSKPTIKIPGHYCFCLHLHALSNDSYITFLIRSLSHCIALTIILWFTTLSDLNYFFGNYWQQNESSSNIHIPFKINKRTASGSWCSVLISASLSIPAPEKCENTYVYFPWSLEHSL